MEKNKNFRDKIFALKRDAILLQNIRFITNECLSNGAYSSKNELEQFSKLEKLNTPQWEIDIIHNAMTFKRKLAHKTLKDLNDLLEKHNDFIGGKE